MAFSQREFNIVASIDHPTVRGVVEELGRLDCEVLVAHQLYRVGEKLYTMRDLIALLYAHATDADGNRFHSANGIDLGILRYQQIVGVKPPAAWAVDAFCQGPFDSQRALRDARRIAGWSAAGVRAQGAEERRQQVEQSAHVILRFVENVKRRIMGLPLEGQQIILDFFGESGAFKTVSMRHLLSPLKNLCLQTPSLESILNGFEGVSAATYAVIWLDDSTILPRKLLPMLKQFVHAETWRANTKGEDAQFLPMLSALAVTHNPWPEEQYPDAAMSRRLGIVHYPTAMDRDRARAFVDEHIFSMDMEAFWCAVDPINRASDNRLVNQTQDRFAIQDPINWFMEECTARKGSHDVWLSDLFAAFRVRATQGGWAISHWTDRTLASWLRSQNYVLTRGSQGMKVKGLKLLQPGSFEAFEAATETAVE